MRILSVPLGLFIMVATTEASTQDLAALKANLIHLASDSLGGRGPASEGARLAAEHIAQQFRAIGLTPYNGESFFQPFDMPNQSVPERNVIGWIRAGSATERSIVFTAHYDGYGIRKSADGGDSIYNAASDNAAGVAALIELARMYMAKGAPRQNLVFIATAAEERGARSPTDTLTGAAYYVNHPLFPIVSVTANLNIDGFNNVGPTADYWVMPRQGVNFVPDIVETLRPFAPQYAPPDWVDGMNTSFDTRAFLSHGVPAVTIWTGFTLRPGTEGSRPRIGRIHTPGDEYNDTWRFDGALENLRMYEAVADRLLRGDAKWAVTERGLFQETPPEKAAVPIVLEQMIERAPNRVHR